MYTEPSVSIKQMKWSIKITIACLSSLSCVYHNLNPVCVCLCPGNGRCDVSLGVSRASRLWSADLCDCGFFPCASLDPCRGAFFYDGVCRSGLCLPSCRSPLSVSTACRPRHRSTSHLFLRTMSWTQEASGSRTSQEVRGTSEDGRFEAKVKRAYDSEDRSDEIFEVGRVEM